MFRVSTDNKSCSASEYSTVVLLPTRWWDIPAGSPAGTNSTCTAVIIYSVIRKYVPLYLHTLFVHVPQYLRLPSTPDLEWIFKTQTFVLDLKMK